MKTIIRQYCNSFSGKIISIVVLGFFLISFLLSFVLLAVSQSVFVQTYSQSLEKVMNQIENDFTTLHRDLGEIVDSIDSSWAFRLYLTDSGRADNLEQFQNAYQMEQDLERSLPSYMNRLNVLVLGVNGSHYLSKTETVCLTQEEILHSQAARKAVASPGTMQYTFAHGAFTMTTKEQDVLIVSQALVYQDTRNIYGVVFFTFTQDDLYRFYEYFVTDNTSLFLVDDAGTVVSSNHRQAVGTPMELPKNRGAAVPGIALLTGSTVLSRELPFQHLTLYGVVDDQLAIYQLYDLPFLICICIGISTVLILIVLFYTRRTLAPLSQMVRTMSQVRDGVLTEHVPVTGTTEIRELAEAYNRMVDALQDYIQQLVSTREKQLRYEIKALQMQINPHYIYNTLASIKMLVFQNARQQAVETLDAFIALLRSTISNTDEFVTIQQEIENLKNYMLIIRTRYGDRIHAEYYVSGNCYHCRIPKMILQPFLENAVFHAFPDGRKGTIQVVIRRSRQQLIIRIQDDGVGMQQQKADRLVERSMKKEYFSGIGIHNVDDRLKLLFGEQYGVRIESQPEEGTTIIITLPLNDM